MDVIEVETWDDLEKEILKLRNYHIKKTKDTQLYVSELLFRGHANASWKLDTTLERYITGPISLKKYHKYLSLTKPAIETYTGRIWDLGNENEFNNDKVIDWPGYPMMIYVRHHGFPSPLLDWTLSPYIAIYFALSPNNEDGRASLYAFIETTEGIKSGRTNSPRIIGRDQYATSHERHFSQQARYTVCIEKPKKDWIYSNHESYFKSLKKKKRNDRQDYIKKITFPRHIRSDVLHRLDLMNINEYSLFHTEEALMNMLAFREISKQK